MPASGVPPGPDVSGQAVSSCWQTASRGRSCSKRPSAVSWPGSMVAAGAGRPEPALTASQPSAGNGRGPGRAGIAAEGQDPLVRRDAPTTRPTT
jgi:hypothetical protein